MIWMNIFNFPMKKLKYKKLFKVTRQWPYQVLNPCLMLSYSSLRTGPAGLLLLLPNVEVIYKKTITSAFHRAMFRYPRARPPQCEPLLLGFCRDPSGCGHGGGRMELHHLLWLLSAWSFTSTSALAISVNAPTIRWGQRSKHYTSFSPDRKTALSGLPHTTRHSKNKATLETY